MDIEIIWRGTLILDAVLDKSIFHIQLFKYYMSVIYDRNRFQKSKETGCTILDFRFFQICFGQVNKTLDDFFSKRN